MIIGIHAFIPRAFKLGQVPTCQTCPFIAAHAVHDWLTPITPEELVQLDTLPAGEEAPCPHGWSMRSFCQECRLDDVRAQTEAEWAERDAQQPDSSQPAVEEVL